MNKKIAFAVGAFLIVFAALILVFSRMKYEYRVVIDDTRYTVEVADTSYLQEKGLSGHAPLSEEEGMLFIFSKPDTYGFWMKDMLFPLDIVWIGEDQRIVYIQKNVSPQSYPSVFHPAVPALYVLEISAGESDKRGIKIGDSVKFEKKKL